MEIKKVAIIGAGIMGNGIAQVVSSSGLEASLVDVKDSFLQKAKSTIDKSLTQFAEKGKITSDQKVEIMGRIRFSVDLAESVKDADLIIEAVPENLDLKKNTFIKVDEFAKHNAILATNTSQYSITEIASVIKNRSRFLGMHFFNPPVLMRLLEIVKGIETSEEVLNDVKSLALKLGKEAVICKDSQGFITTRVLLALRLECYRIFEEGIASKEDIDKALKLAFGHPMGQFELADYSGLDLEPPAYEAMTRVFGDRFRPPQTVLHLVKAGKLGRKTGSGWYQYTK